MKINNTLSSWVALIQRVTQGSVIGLLLFNIYINDLFLTLRNIDICNFANDATLYAYNENLEKVSESLEQNAEVALIMFKNSYMTLKEINAI